METGLSALGLLGLIRVVEADECRRVGGCEGGCEGERMGVSGRDDQSASAGVDDG